MLVLKEFPRLVEAVRKNHAEFAAKIVHHDFDHALQVAQVALKIAGDPKTARLAAVAALCHNADRILEERADGIVKKAGPIAIENLARSWLGVESTFSEEDKRSIVEALVEHSKPNSDKDSNVIVTLKDADRIVNLGLDVIVRGAQHHNCSAIDPWLLLNDERGNHAQRQSIVKVLQDCLEWASDDPRFGVRLPKSKEMARVRAKALQQYINTVIAQRKELGLVPYPLSR